jgi:ribosomal protein S18 acetylase RimI-like enzyme
LFVSKSNAEARRLYLRLGFRDVPYPEAMPSGMDAHYMIADAAALTP